VVERHHANLITVRQVTSPFMGDISTDQFAATESQTNNTDIDTPAQQM
jgi:hypothetical protein